MYPLISIYQISMFEKEHEYECIHNIYLPFAAGCNVAADMLWSDTVPSVKFCILNILRSPFSDSSRRCYMNHSSSWWLHSVLSLKTIWCKNSGIWPSPGYFADHSSAVFLVAVLSALFFLSFLQVRSVPKKENSSS